MCDGTNMGLVAATDVASKVLNKAGAHLVRRVEHLTGLSADNGERLLPLFGPVWVPQLPFRWQLPFSGQLRLRV